MSILINIFLLQQNKGQKITKTETMNLKNNENQKKLMNTFRVNTI